jgi:hypothetical protein
MSLEVHLDHRMQETASTGSFAPHLPGCTVLLALSVKRKICCPLLGFTHPIDMCYTKSEHRAAIRAEWTTSPCSSVPSWNSVSSGGLGNVTHIYSSDWSQWCAGKCLITALQEKRLWSAMSAHLHSVGICYDGLMSGSPRICQLALARR